MLTIGEQKMQEYPKLYLVCVRLPLSKHSDPTKLYRVGIADSLSECKELIKEDLAEMKDTMGGLIEPTSIKGRKYEVFKANWEKVELK
jgi:hypothetical protein